MKPERMEIITRTYYGAEESSTEISIKLIAEDNNFCIGCYFDQNDLCAFPGDVICTSLTAEPHSIIWKKDLSNV